MKSNPGKWDLFVSSCEKIKMEIGNFEIENITCDFILIIIYHGYVNKLVKKLIH